jgi:flagellar hook-basal body complex protein FliE
VIVPPIPPLAAQTGATPAEGLGGSAPTGYTEAIPAGEAAASGGAEGAGATSFGSELTEAISSLEDTQRNANVAEQALATGQVKDPESAVVTVEDAAMAMQLAAQIRSKAAEAAQTIFQTQV